MNRPLSGSDDRAAPGGAHRGLRIYAAIQRANELALAAGIDEGFELIRVDRHGTAATTVAGDGAVRVDATSLEARELPFRKATRVIGDPRAVEKG